MTAPIWRENIETRDGNILSVFFNSSANLLVVDVIHRSGSGGNEIVRLRLDEQRLLAHCLPSRRRGIPRSRKASL